MNMIAVLNVCFCRITFLEGSKEQGYNADSTEYASNEQQGCGACLDRASDKGKEDEGHVEGHQLHEYNSKPNSHCLNGYSVLLAEKIHLTAEKFENIRQWKIPFLLHKTSQH